jgi:lysine/ornithine N-monooxygenase
MAAGISRFPHLPDFVAGLPPRLASHTSAHRDFGGFAGADVIVVGAGQSALESAALLNEAGASVEVIARSGITWVNRQLHASPLLASLLYAPSDVGPAGLSRLVHRQLLVRRLPSPLRRAVTRRCVRPSGATWLRERVVDRVRLSDHVWVLSATAAGPGVRLRLSDGSVRHADHLLLGTGYRPDVRALDMLDADLVARVAAGGPLPRLNRWFESAVPGLHFVGALAERDFGPLCRFVAGARQAASQVARRALTER